MNPPFQLTSQAIEDLDAIWWTIAEENQDAAERVEMEILATCHRLARHPRIGHEATGHHDAASSVLDYHEVPQLCDRLPSRD